MRFAGLAILLCAVAASAACSGDKKEPHPLVSGSGSGASGGSGGKKSSGSGATNAGGEGANLGAGGASDTGGAAQGVAGAGCGDGFRTDPEECDGDDFGQSSCLDFGFDDGALACSSQCEINHDACSGTEHCGDGRDNDGDGLVDCDDEDDCASACAMPCSGPEVVSDPADITATTKGRGDAVNSSCSSTSATDGPDSIYEITVAHTGMLEVAFESDALMHVSVRNDCTDTPELACSIDFMSTPVTKGDKLYVAVESYGLVDVGTFTLHLASRPLDVCGDGYRDPSEECEDGNDDPNDACDDNCILKSDEDEQNGTTDTANAYHDAFFASIDPAGDVDVFSVAIAAGPASITATVQGLIDECERGKIDSFLELLDSNGDPVASDDDGGDNYCSRLVAPGLATGTYYVRVTASDSGETPTFPYQLLVSTNACGDGVLGPGEECDDGAKKAGDGCSATCQNE